MLPSTGQWWNREFENEELHGDVNGFAEHVTVLQLEFGVLLYEVDETTAAGCSA